MRILVNTPMKLQNEENNYNARPSYCNASSINEVKSNKKSSTFCRKLDGLFLNWPVESRAVTLATYIKEKWQRATDCAAALVYDPENPIRFEDLRYSCVGITYTLINGFRIIFSSFFVIYIIIIFVSVHCAFVSLLCFLSQRKYIIKYIIYFLLYI